MYAVTTLPATQGLGAVAGVAVGQGDLHAAALHAAALLASRRLCCSLAGNFFSPRFTPGSAVTLDFDGFTIGLFGSNPVTNNPPADNTALDYSLSTGGFRLTPVDNGLVGAAQNAGAPQFTIINDPSGHPTGTPYLLSDLGDDVILDANGRAFGAISFRLGSFLAASLAGSAETLEVTATFAAGGTASETFSLAAATPTTAAFELKTLPALWGTGLASLRFHGTAADPASLTPRFALDSLSLISPAS